jgi:glycine/D-amino acid oxidase-like deaminating enzyme
MRKILIVGAGQSGLQLALGLNTAGYEVTVMTAYTGQEIHDGASPAPSACSARRSTWSAPLRRTCGPSPATGSTPSASRCPARTAPARSTGSATSTSTPKASTSA